MEMNNLLEWCKKNGAFVDERVHFKNGEHGVYGVTPESIPENTSLIRVPTKLLLTPDVVSESIEVVEQDITDEMKFHLLLAILRFSPEKLPKLDRFWRPYIASLPSTFTTPYYWQPNERKCLEGTDAYVFLERDLQKYFKEWLLVTTDFLLTRSISDLERFNQFHDYYENKDLMECVFDDNVDCYLDFKAYIWAVNIVKSRGFPMILFKQKGVFLWPIVDLLNHKNDSEVNWTFISNQDSIEFKNKSALSPGEVFNNYGDKSNTDLLVNYGFVSKQNKYETSFVTLQVDSLERIQQLAAHTGLTSLVRQMNEDGTNFAIKNDLPQNLVDFCAIVNQLPSEFGKYTVRMQLEGLKQTLMILQDKLQQLKEKVPHKLANAYRISQKQNFQVAYEKASSKEKDLIKKHKLTTFKSALKQDAEFKEWAQRYTDWDELFVVWIAASQPPGRSKKYPQFVIDQYNSVEQSIEITQEDKALYAPALAKYFGSQSGEPSCKWKFNVSQLIVADTVADRVKFTRASNGEIYLVNGVV